MLARIHMFDDFTLLDLSSQAAAVERLLWDLAIEEKVAWLAARGKLVPKQKALPEERQTYWFESCIGMKCAFCFYAGNRIGII
jgi:hypothetical protein